MIPLRATPQIFQRAVGTSMRAVTGRVFPVPGDVTASMIATTMRPTVQVNR